MLYTPDVAHLCVHVAAYRAGSAVFASLYAPRYWAIGVVKSA